MLIRKTLFSAFTLVSGAAIACGYVAFITLLGVFEKLSEKYKTMNMTIIIEWLIITGVTTGNLFFFLDIPLSFGSNSLRVILYMLFNLIGGAFIGCLIGALAETLCIFPIISRRFGIRKLLPYVLFAAALGKVIGAYIELYII